MHRLLKALFKERAILLGTAALFALAAALAVQFVDLQYRARTAIVLGEAARADVAGLETRLATLKSDPRFHRELTDSTADFTVEVGGETTIASRLAVMLDEARSTAEMPRRAALEMHVAEFGRSVEILVIAPTAEIARAVARRAAMQVETALQPPAVAAPQAPDAQTNQAAVEARERVQVAEAAVEEAANVSRSASTPAAVSDASQQSRRAALDTRMSETAGRRDALRALADAPATTSDPGFQALPELAPLLAERDRLARAVGQLSVTLLDGHPRLRIARLRLSEVEAQLAERAGAAADRVEAELDAARAEVAALDTSFAAAEATRQDEARRAAVSAQEDLAAAEAELQAARQALDAALSAPVASLPVVTPPATSQPTSPPIVVEALQPSAAGPAAAAGTAGLVLASLFVVLRDSVVHRVGQARAQASSAALLDRRNLVAKVRPARPREGGSREEIVAGLLESGVRRVIVLSQTYDVSSIASVDIARRLTLEGRAVLLVDLSADRRAATAMGVSARRPTLAEAATDDVPLRGLVTRDFATGAYAAAGWRLPLDDKPTQEDIEAVVRALLAAERDFDVVILDGDTLAAADLERLAGDDVALLFSIEGAGEAEIETRLSDLTDGGFDEPLLVFPSRALRDA